MDEFIVWDEENSEFLSISEIKENSDFDLIWDYKKNNIGLKCFNSGDGWTPERGEFSEPSWEDIKIKTFPYIGKTDIDSNKIYADSSIVEFDVIQNCHCNILEIECECVPNKRIGYFSYNENRLCYELLAKSFKDWKRIFIFDRDTISNLKVIGNLQQHKHLLGDQA